MKYDYNDKRFNLMFAFRFMEFMPKQRKLYDVVIHRDEFHLDIFGLHVPENTINLYSIPENDLEYILQHEQIEYRIVSKTDTHKLGYDSEDRKLIEKYIFCHWASDIAKEIKKYFQKQDNFRNEAKRKEREREREREFLKEYAITLFKAQNGIEPPNRKYFDYIRLRSEYWELPLNSSIRESITKLMNWEELLERQQLRKKEKQYKQDLLSEKIFWSTINMNKEKTT